MSLGRRAVDDGRVATSLVLIGARLAYRGSNLRFRTRFRHHAGPAERDDKRRAATNLIETTRSLCGCASRGLQMRYLFIRIQLQPVHEVAHLVIGDMRHLEQASRLLPLRG